MAFGVSFPVRSAYKDESFRLRCLTGKGADGIVSRLRTVAYNARTCGPYAWATLPERDEFQHSQNFACRSIRPPCQNRGPAKDERKTVRIRPRVCGQRRRRQQLAELAPGAGRLRAGLRGRGERGLLEPARAESPKDRPLARRLLKGDGGRSDGCGRYARCDPLGRTARSATVPVWWGWSS